MVMPLPRRTGDAFIGGDWRSCTSKGTPIPTIDPSTEEVLAALPSASGHDVGKAVEAASGALRTWRSSTPHERSAVLNALADGIEARLDELAELWSQDVGIPVKQARASTAALPVLALRSFAELVHELPLETRGPRSTVRLEAAGVAASITPWNYPLSQIAIKTGSALAAGCTVVAKPSEVAPLCAYVFAEIVESVDLPPGAFNLVPGDGPTTGEALVTHRDVRVVSFTGSTATGARIMTLAASGIKRTTLELGGKSALIVLDAASLEAAAEAVIASCYRNAGQTCTALTRLLVPVELRHRAIEFAVAASEARRVGDPFDPLTDVGPLVSARQRDRVRSLVLGALDQGATMAAGSLAPPPGLERGFYFSPTVLFGVEPHMQVAQEEVFGPVLSIMTFTDHEDALRIADSTDYGLSAAVWSTDEEYALAVARRLDAGTVFVNSAGFDHLAPYGGTKRSGLGRELGRAGIEEFLEAKAIHHSS